MGEAKNKKKRFLADHPYCCFCGGTEPATTIDHVPARTCFLGRAAPEGFEFPACSKCQAASRLDEMAFAMFARVHDINTDNYSTEEMRRCYEGLRNNLPHLLPFTGLSDRDKRKAMRAKGLAKPPNMMVADVPMVGIPAAIGPHIHRYARKLAAALYYREKGKAARLDLLLWTHWAQSVDRLQMEGMLKVAQMAPFRTVGTRINLDFGDRFGYRCDKAEENDLFMAIAQFGQGLVVSMLVAEGLSKQEAEQGGWVKVSAMFD